MLDALFSAGTKLLSGFLNRDAQKDANATAAANAAATNAANERINERNIALQKEFAQNAVQWKAKDAANAGIHPIFAMGGSTTSFSPVALGAVSPGVTPTTGLGDAVGAMGSDISRAVSAYRSPGEKVAAVVQAQNVAGNALDLETKKLNNDLLRARIQQITQPGVPPGLPDFPVPEASKAAERPPLMFGGSRWLTNPNTSPMKAWEDQYGDEGLVSWLLPPVIAANDAAYNLRRRALGVETARDASDRWVSGLGAGHAQISRWYNAARSRLFGH